VVIVATGLMVAGAAASTRTGMFHVRGIDVEGSAHRSSAQIVRTSGLSPRDNALWLDESAAEARLLRDPWIARADVSVDLPWTVTISVTERSPIASTERGSDRTLVGLDGTILGPGRLPGLPVIDAPPAWVDPSGSDGVADAAHALFALGGDLRSRVRRLVVGGPEGLELVLTDGLRVRFGPPGDYEAKGRVLEEVLRWIEREDGRFRVVDVSAPSAPAVIAGG
jgi:cell division protein FtsQ